MLTRSRVVEAARAALLNFVIVGGHRSGVGVLQGTLDKTPGVVCHGDLLFDEHGSPQERDAIRRAAHESYFGVCRDPVRLPEWCHAETNPYRYLSDYVFDNPLGGEAKVGVKALYDTVRKYEMYDLIEERWREGDFCVIHVIRNPIACIVSAEQARRSGVWCQSAAGGGPQAYPPSSVYLDPIELAAQVHRHQAIQKKVEKACSDAIKVRYRDLVFRFDATVADVLEFLELPQQRVARPPTQRLRNRDMPSRISNFEELHARLPEDVRCLLEEDLF